MSRVIDGEQQPQSLFGMIRHTHWENPQGTIVAYSDNAAVMEGREVRRFKPSQGVYGYEAAEVLRELLECDGTT